MQLAHAGRRTWRAVGFDVGDLTSIAAAIDAGVALVGVEAQDNVIEYVIRIEAELRLDTLCDGEALRERHVREKCTRSAERIEASIADMTASGKRERSGSRTSQRAGIESKVGWPDCISQWSDRSELIPLSIHFPRSDMERLPIDHVRTARSGVGDLAAFADTRRPWKAAAVVQRIGDLPTAYQQIHRPTASAHELLAPAKRQLVDRAKHEDMVAVERIRSIGDARIDCVVGTVESFGVREGVVPEELEPSGEPLLDFDLQRLVIAAGIVAEISDAADCAASIRQSRHAVKEEATAVGLGREGGETRWPAGCSSLTSDEVRAGSDRRFIRIIGRSRARERVRALVADVRNFEGHR